MKLAHGAFVLAALSLAACNPSKPATPANASDTANVGPASGTPTNTATNTAGSGAPAPSATPCKSGDLSLAHQSDDAGAGQREVVYAFTNNAAAACSLTGFPTLALIDAQGQTIGSVPTVQSEDGDFAANGAPATVNLAPKGKAVFRIRYTGISGAGIACVNTARIRVTPPGNTQAIEVNDALQICDTKVMLSPVRPS
ncbi:MAG TPA: DUF4232 domain-containing protein [Caulobacteraceae bacterium]|jgi:hypothetical protein|nr:DUF4232 domain-containing protein [Caulobacteraceae bacterium]